MPLSPIEQRFVLHWGEMGTRWGINRTVAQVHALLFLSPKPLHAEEIASTLAVARSNVSTSLRELQAWGIVHVVHVLGDRRDHFGSVKDVWEIFRIVAEERKRREIDPTLRVLQECVGELRRAGPSSTYTRERLEEMLGFLTTTSGLFDELVHMPSGALKGTARLRGKLKSLFRTPKKPAIRLGRHDLARIGDDRWQGTARSWLALLRCRVRVLHADRGSAGRSDETAQDGRSPAAGPAWGPCLALRERSYCKRSALCLRMEANTPVRTLCWQWHARCGGRTRSYGYQNFQERCQL